VKSTYSLALSSALLIGFWTIMGPLEFIYYLGYSFKKSRNLKGRRRLPHRVISVGNLTVGGTGKTPAVIAIAEEAKRRRYIPCVLTRGYRGKAKGPCLISKGDGALLSVDEAGDEASLMAERLKGVTIVKGADRYEAGMFALRELGSFASGEHAGTDRFRFLFILDDGFQHWRLYRDLDILLIDSTNPFGDKRLLPSGILREPLEEMSRADIIVLTKTQKEADVERMTRDLTREIKRYNPEAPIYCSGHEPAGLGTASGRELPLNTLAGRPVFAFCGIGNPASFQNTLVRINAEVRGFMTFRDHHAYRRQDLSRVSEAAKGCSADWIVTTEKDIMRLRDFNLPENIVSLRIEFEVEKAFYDRLFVEA
jgi:tetraacyldisaccharide 4'-kinase